MIAINLITIFTLGTLIFVRSQVKVAQTVALNSAYIELLAKSNLHGANLNFILNLLTVQNQIEFFRRWHGGKDGLGLPFYIILYIKQLVLL